MEIYSHRDMIEVDIDASLIQDNQFMSKKGAFRRLHFKRNFHRPRLLVLVEVLCLILLMIRYYRFIF